jgi:site-specific recombinase
MVMLLLIMFGMTGASTSRLGARMNIRNISSTAATVTAVVVAVEEVFLMFILVTTTATTTAATVAAVEEVFLMLIFAYKQDVDAPVIPNILNRSIAIWLPGPRQA